MNGFLTTHLRAVPDAFDEYCGKVEVALRDLKLRLQARYARLFPGEEERITEAIIQAELMAWSTDVPHLFLPDLAEEAIARLSLFSRSKQKDESSNLADMASSVR